MPKQVLTSVNLFAFGSYMAAWRAAVLVGNAFADGCDEPSWQNAGLFAGRTCDVNQARPFWSIIGLWVLVWLSQIGSAP